MGKQIMVTIASCALVKGYAITVVNAISARNVEVHQYAITVVDAVSARNVEVHQYAITVVDAVVARNAKGVKNEANGTEAQKHAIALPHFQTDNSSTLDVGHFLQTMNASGD